MARKPFKTFKATDASALKKIVSAFNRKRNRAEKKYGYQPEKIKYSELIENISSRQEFNRIKNVYSRYLKPGQEKLYTNNSGITTTRWLRNEANYAIRRINNARMAKKEEIGLNRELSRQTIDELNLRPRTNHIKTITNQGYINKYFKSLQKNANIDYYRKGEEQYKKNYLKSLRDVYGNVPGFNELYTLVKNLPGSTLISAAADNPTFSISFQYGFEDTSLRVEYLIEQWDDYLQ